MKKTVMFLASLVIVLFGVSSFLGTVGAVVSGGEGDYCDATSDCVSGECSIDGLCINLGAEDCWSWGYGGGYGCDSDQKCVWGYGYGYGCGYGGDCGYDPECEEEGEEAVCGDGDMESGEECDDGNTDNGDGCNDKCLSEYIGLGIAMDYNYIIETQKKRAFRPNYKKITPFDDINCILKVRESKNPRDKTYEGRFYLVDSKGNQEYIQGTNLLSRYTFAKNGGGLDYYVWRIKGWPTGWGPGAVNMTKLVNEGSVICSANVGGKTNFSRPLRPETCVHITGPDDANFKIVNSFGDSVRGSSYWVFEKGMRNTLGLMRVDPFRQYPQKFAHYVDLKSHDDSGWKTYRGGNRTYFNHSSKLPKGESAWKQVVNKSTCDFKGKQYNFYSDRTYSGYTIRGQPVVFMDSSKNNQTTLHETGHNFCYINDEYPFSSKKVFYKGNKNCVQNISFIAPLGFVAPLGITGSVAPLFELYGGAGFNNSGKGCSFGLGFNVPSEQSIMNHYWKAPKFNVISCGYCLGKIINKTLDSDLGNNFGACMNNKWNTIKPGDQSCFSHKDCATDGNSGCSYCNDNKCVYKGIDKNGKARECMLPDESKTSKWSVGTCGNKQANSKSACNAVAGWECTSRASNLKSLCPTNAAGKSVIKCENHKCVYPK